MTPQQLAEKYVKNDALDLDAYTIGRVKRAFIKGYEANQSKWISVDVEPTDLKTWYICANSIGNYFIDRMYQYSPSSGWWGYGDKEPDDRVDFYISISDLLPLPPKP